MCFAYAYLCEIIWSVTILGISQSIFPAAVHSSFLTSNQPSLEMQTITAAIKTLSFNEFIVSQFKGDKCFAASVGDNRFVNIAPVTTAPSSIYPKYRHRSPWANSVDPDHPDQGLQCLPFNQNIFGTSPKGSNCKDNYSDRLQYLSQYFRIITSDKKSYHYPVIIQKSISFCILLSSSGVWGANVISSSIIVTLKKDRLPKCSNIVLLQSSCVFE